LIQACTGDQKAAEFSVSLVQENPQISYQQTRDAFTSRFEKEVRSRGTVARDKLFSRKIRMNSYVQEYINDFRQQILHIPDMHEEDKIHFFHTGLTPQLVPFSRACHTDYYGGCLRSS